MQLTPEMQAILTRYYPDQGAHGRNHAIAVAELTEVLAEQPEYEGVFSDDHKQALALAGIFHDTGYGQVDQRFASGLNWEHTVHSAQIALEYLLENKTAFGLENSTIAMVAGAIFNHDNTNYRFPHYPRNERARTRRALAPRQFESHLDPGVILPLAEKIIRILGVEPDDIENYTALSRAFLQVLQEADGLLSEAQRTLDFSKSRNLPLVKPDLPHGWQVSVESNVLWAVTRAVLDAYTRYGQERAQAVYEQGIQLLMGIVSEHVHKDPFEAWYAPDYEHSFLRPEDLALIWSQHPIQRWKYDPKVLEDKSRFSDSDFEQIDMSFYYPKYSIQYANPVTREITQSVEDVYSRDMSTHFYPRSRIVPVGLIAQVDDRLEDPMNAVRTPEYMVPKLREGLIKSYGFDILTQLRGSVQVFVSGCHPVWGPISGEIEICSPWVAGLPGSDQLVVLRGSAMIEEAREVGREFVRVIDVGIKRA